MIRLSRYRPTNLHIGHGWGGGIERWIRLFGAADDRSNNLVFSSKGRDAAYGMGFELRAVKSWELLETGAFGWPIASTVVTHAESRQCLLGVIERYDVAHVYVSTVIGHSLDLLSLPVPTTVVHHDYFPHCVALNPYFGETCTRCTDTELSACLDRNPRSALFRHNGAAYWKALREAYLEKVAAPHLVHVAPSDSVPRQLRRLEPRYRDLPCEVIPHGNDIAPVDCFGGAEEGRRLRVLMLGRFTEHKGASFMRKILPRLRLFADVLLVGSGPEARDLVGERGMTIIEEFDSAELGTLLQQLRPDVALNLSYVPETFSFTLSEVWGFGIPACAFRTGSFEERITDGEDGFFIPANADAVLAKLSGFDSDREELRRVHDNLKRKPARTAAEMVSDYYRLRSDYLSHVERLLIAGTA